MKSPPTLPPFGRSVLSAGLLALTLSCLGVDPRAQAPRRQPVPHPSFEIQLRSRSFTPEPGIEPEVRLQAERGLGPKAQRHVYVQFERPPDPLERELLEDVGLRLLAPVGSKTWQAVLTRPQAMDWIAAHQDKESPPVRWMGIIPPLDKRSPYLDRPGLTNAPAMPAASSVIVHFFADVSPTEARRALARAGAEIVGTPPVGRQFVVSLPPDRVAALADVDSVSWIEPVPPPGSAESDRARAHLQVEAAQALGYDGNGVLVGVFEAGHVADGHPDLIGRVTKGDTDPWDRDQHPTMTGGFIAGDGSRSTSAVGGGSPLQYRGMAPAARLVTYDFWVGEAATWADAYLNFLGDLFDGIHVREIAIGNNSWGTTGGCSVIGYGDYTELCDDLDTAVCGAGEYQRPAILVFSAGNERDGFGSADTRCLTETALPFRNYGTLNHPKAAKNILVVGAVDSHDNRMTSYSSWGPTADGRIKPDLVSVGHHRGTVHDGVTEIDNPFGSPYGAANQQDYRSANDDYPPAGTYTYGWYSQTSAAAASCSGAIALLLDAHRELLHTGIDPLPSTVRALLVHTAQDLDDSTSWYNAGPDYASGYGLLRLTNAIACLGTGKIIEAKVTGGRPDRFQISLPAGQTSLKLTLAWDDPAPAPASAKALVNDLDLVVTDPTGTQYFPWTLDPATPTADAVRTQADHVNNLEQVLVDASLTGGAALPAGTWEIRVEPFSISVQPQRYSLIGSERLMGAVDVMLVLDRSGSMNGMASAGMPDTKIETLRSAATQLVDVMLPDAGYQLGLVQFNEDVVPFPAGSDDALAPHTTLRAPGLRSTIGLINAGGWTSIGDGLREALHQLTGSPSPPDIDRVILLVTDGQENRAEWISDVRSDLLTEDVTVNIIGLGYGSGVDEAKLTDLATATHGTYRITADHVAFRKLFLEALMGVVDWSVVTDPAGQLRQGRQVVVPFDLAADETRAVVTAFWEGANDGVLLSLVTPAGQVISPTTDNTRIRYVSHPRYAVFDLDFPLAGDLADQWAGRWRARLVGSPQLEARQSVLYSASVFVEGGARLDVAGPDLSVNLTGQPIPLQVRLSRAGHPLLQAKVQVDADVPLVAVNDLLHRSTAAFSTRLTDGDPLDPVARKLELLGECGANRLRRGLETFPLFDDGQHGDGKAGDGVYGGVFDATRMPGNFTFRVRASEIAVGRGWSTRERSFSVHNAVRIDPRSSWVHVTTLEGDSQRRTYRVDIEPRDPYGHYLGPGHQVQGVLSSPTRQEPVTFKDAVDGRYTAWVTLPPQRPKREAVLDVRVDRRPFMQIHLDGPSVPSERPAMPLP